MICTVMFWRDVQIGMDPSLLAVWTQLVHLQANIWYYVVAVIIVERQAVEPLIVIMVIPLRTRVEMPGSGLPAVQSPRNSLIRIRNLHTCHLKKTNLSSAILAD